MTWGVFVRHFWVPELQPTFKMRPSGRPFAWQWVKFPRTKNRFHIQPLPLTPTFALFAISTFPKMHLIPPYPPPPPPPQRKEKFGMTFVFHFSWVLQASQETFKPVLMQNFGGQIRCVMRNVKEAFPWKKKDRLIASYIHPRFKTEAWGNSSVWI